MPSQAAGIRCTGVSRLEATAAKGSRAHLLDPNTAIFPGFLAADRIGPLKTLDVLTIRRLWLTQRAAGSSKGAVPPPIEFGYCASVLSATQDFRTLAAAPPSIAASARARANFMRSRRVPELDLS